MDVIKKLIINFDLETKYISSFTNSSRYGNNKVDVVFDGWGGVTVVRVDCEKTFFKTHEKDANFEIYINEIFNILNSI